MPRFWHWSSSSSSSTEPSTHATQSSLILTGSMLELAMSFLPMRDLLKVARVSRSWLHASDSKLAWRAITEKQRRRGELFIDGVFTHVRLPLSEENRNRCQAPKIEHVSWRDYTSKAIAKFFHKHRFSMPMSMLRDLLAKLRLIPTPPSTGLSWLASSICRRHLPLAVLLPPAGVCQDNPHNADVVLSQASALQHLTAFGHINSISVDLDIDSVDNSWLSRILSSPVIQHVRYFTTFSPDVWTNSEQLQEVASRLSSLQQIRFSMWMCRRCDNPHLDEEAQAEEGGANSRNPNCKVAAKKAAFAINKNNRSIPSASDLSRFTSVRSVYFEDLDEWPQWDCLSGLPTLRSLFVFRYYESPPCTIPTHEIFAELPKKMGLQKLIKLNLASPADISPISAETWVTFLSQMPALQWLRVEGASLGSFMTALRKIGDKTSASAEGEHQESALMRLKEVRCRVGTADSLIEFHSDEFEALLQSAMASFDSKHEMQMRLILPQHGLFATEVPEHMYFMIYSRMSQLTKLNIPRLSIERDSEEDDGGFAAMVEAEDGESIY